MQTCKILKGNRDLGWRQNNLLCNTIMNKERTFKRTDWNIKISSKALQAIVLGESHQRCLFIWLWTGFSEVGPDAHLPLCHINKHWPLVHCHDSAFTLYHKHMCAKCTRRQHSCKQLTTVLWKGTKWRFVSLLLLAQSEKRSLVQSCILRPNAFRTSITACEVITRFFWFGRCLLDGCRPSNNV